jgi:pSer/pThr/pTyr-binding forkhead associated (FHA) protein
MAGTVTLTVVGGACPGQEYEFRGRTVCTVGRSDDCRVHLPNNWLHVNVSRRHCLLDVDPPLVRVRDLGSRNGTFVNGELIGQRPCGLLAEHADPARLHFHPLHDGDEIRVGDTVFLVTVSGGDEAEGERYHDPCGSEVLVG